MRGTAILVVILWTALIWTLPAAAEPKDPNYPSDPGQLVQVKWDAVMVILQDKTLAKEVKAKKIAKTLGPAFDFDLMGKLALGRKHWPKLNKDQQKQYIKLFSERLKTSYQQKISLYKDQKVTFKPARVMPNKTVQVPTELLTEDSKYVIVYKLRKKGDKWMVYDVEIQGVSILITYRSQFDDILRRNSVDLFLERLEKPVEKK
jgi:phospholipid transport system substrate-binding protein